MTVNEFCTLWDAAASLQDVADATGRSPRACSQRAYEIRRRGRALKRFAGGGGGGVAGEGPSWVGPYGPPLNKKSPSPVVAARGDIWKALYLLRSGDPPPVSQTEEALHSALKHLGASGVEDWDQSS